MNALQFAWSLKNTEERLRFRDWCYLLACEYRRDEIRAGRGYELRKSEVRRYLVKRIKRHEKYKAVPTWLITIAVNLVLQIIMRWLEKGPEEGGMGHA